MASLPVTFAPGSPQTSASFRDALAAYRRSQYFVANSKVVSSTSELFDPFEPLDIAENSDRDNLELPKPHDTVVAACSNGELDWDDPDLDPSIGRIVVGPPQVLATRLTIHDAAPASSTHERSPLLHRSVSFSHPTYVDGAAPLNPLSVEGQLDKSSLGQPHVLTRRNSSGSCKSTAHNYSGESTYGQTLFNSIAILVGVGMLSEPLAFAYAGWIGGTVLIVSYGFISCYTAKILARMILDDPRLRSYSDIGLKAFGPKSTILTGGLFCLELFAVSVLLVTLFADSLHTVAPTYSTDVYKIMGLIILIPTMFLPLSLLSYTSILGIISTLSIIAVILVDGFSKRQGPGSLWRPAETSFGISSPAKLGVSFGLFMAGFSGHAVIPSLARDMINPNEFDKMINWAFVVATFTYASIGCAGYLMFGNEVNEEISVNLLQTPGYPAILNYAVLWMLVISPLTKFALSTRPINVIIENFFGLDPNSVSIFANRKSLPVNNGRSLSKRSFIILERILLPVFSVCVSILLPNFSSTMAFLGSFAAFTICVIGPIAAHIALTGQCSAFDASILLVIGVMAIWGTVAAFWEG